MVTSAIFRQHEIKKPRLRRVTCKSHGSYTFSYFEGDGSVDFDCPKCEKAKKSMVQPIFPPSEHARERQDANVKQKVVSDVCEKHGSFTRKETLTPVGWFASLGGECPKCRESRKKEEAEELKAKKEFNRRQKTKSLLEASGIPGKYNHGLDSWVPNCQRSRNVAESAKEYAKAWERVSLKGTSLIFTGGVGTGKTHLACSIAHEIIHVFQSTAKYLTFSELCDRVKDTFRKNAEESESATKRELSNYDLLIMDEMGVQHFSEFETLLLNQVINSRYNVGKPTILVSNLNVSELKEAVGERIIDRMKENGGRVLVFDWGSRR